MSCKEINNVYVCDAPCTPGYVKGILGFVEKPTPIALASLDDIDVWEALAQAEPNDNMFYIPSKFVPEFTDRENVTEELLGGGQTIVDTTKAPDIFRVYGNNCNIESLHREFKNSQTIYVYYVTKQNQILGKLSSDRLSLEAVKVNVWSIFTAGTPEAVSKVHLNVQELEDWDANRRGVEITFDIEDIEFIKTLFAVSATGNATANTVTLKLELAGGSPFLDASTKTAGDASFFVYDDDLVTVGTPTAVTRTGVSNEYVLTFASISAGTHYVKYDPTVEDDGVYLPLTEFEVVTP
jgi:hypothetical protein